MSSGDRIPSTRALPWARRFVATIKPFCVRAEIAGSLRRKAKTVGDVEIVCEPIREEVEEPAQDLFGSPRRVVRYPLHAELARLVEAGVLKAGTGGEKYRKHLILDLGIPLDLFMVTPPADYFCILAIRTGPANFSRRLVTIDPALGYHFNGGCLVDVHTRKRVPTGSEATLFALVGQPWLEPEDRR